MATTATEKRAPADKPLRTVPYPVTNPERIPVQRYFDAEFYKLECERLWPHVWQMACRLEEIPRVGDWVEYENLDKSVIVVRTKEGIKAFHNACRHRGVKVAISRGNCRKSGFICPFHGWRYNMDGENIFVFGSNLFSEENLRKADLALAPCRAEMWGGCVFINLDKHAPPLLECLGPLTKRLDARHVEKLKVDAWVSTVLPVNWKLAMEAFMEGYHVMRTHPQLQALLNPATTRFGSDFDTGPSIPRQLTPKQYIDLTIRFLTKLSDGMGGMITREELVIAEGLRDMAIPDDIPGAARAFYSRLNDEITARERARGVPVFDLTHVAATEKFNGVEFLFPHFFLLPMFSAMSSYRIRPLGPESCLFEIWSLALHPDNEERPIPVAPSPSPYDGPTFPEIPHQDFSNLPIQQRGLHAGGFEYMRLSRATEGMISNYQRLIDGYLAGVEPSRLAQATQVVGSGYDVPILDIGF